MTRKRWRRIGLAGLIAGLSLCVQSTWAQTQFEIADVHATPRTEVNTFMGVNPPVAGRYEYHSASLIDLIHTAYGVDPDKILDGPNWLEMDRFDVIAQVPAGTNEKVTPGAPPGTPPDAVAEMLQSLLADRFKLVLHRENKPLPGYALSVSKKPLLKEADGTGDTGCRVQGAITAPDPTAHYACRNVTMESFAALFPGLVGVPFRAVVNQTGLDGRWNFDMKWALGNGVDANYAAAFADSIEKQIGLKLEPTAIPTPVILVESAVNPPTGNPPGVAEKLPPVAQPTAFDVATIKPTDPDFRGSTSNAQPTRWIVRGQPLDSLLIRAFAASYAQRNADLVQGIPDWASTARFDITAEMPKGAPANARIGPMLRSLLEDRLNLRWHAEDRPVSGFALVADKPKMKKADPASRTHCNQANPPAGSPPRTLSLACQNITMEQFADLIHTRVPGPGWPVINSTGIEGGWDFTLTWSLNPIVPLATQAGAGPAPVAPDVDGGLTIFEALEKQVGLKLVTQKQTASITVIDRLDKTPTNN